MRIAVSSMLAAMALFGGVASAQPQTVRLSDLNLSSNGGAERALVRLEKATKRACREEFRHSVSDSRANRRACEQQSMSVAVASLNAPEVSRMYAERGGRPIQVAAR